MIYTCAQLVGILGNFSKIKSAVKQGRYYKISHGIYSDSIPNISELEAIFVRFPGSILTLESAFAFYDLSDFIPDFYIVATSQKSHRIKNNKIKQLFISDDLLNIGKTNVTTAYGNINIYDKERLLIELFRFKTKLDYAYYKEVVNSFRKLAIENKLDLNKIVKYCAYFKNGVNLRKQIQEVIL